MRTCRCHVVSPKTCIYSYYWMVRNYWANRKHGPRWFHTIQCRGRSWAQFLNYKGPSWFKWFIWDLGLMCERYTVGIENWFEVRAQRKAAEAQAKFDNQPFIKALRNYGQKDNRNNKAN